MKSRSSLFCLLAVAGLLAGCSLPIEPAQPDQRRYFVLGEGRATAVGPAVPVSLAIASVEVADFLDRKGMAVLVAGREVRYAADALWAAPLREAIESRLRDRLGVRATVLAVPIKAGAKRDFDLVVRVTQCSGTAEGGVLFSAWYELRTADGSLRQGNHEAPATAWDGRDYGALADQLGAAVNGLAEAILASAGGSS